MANKDCTFECVCSWVIRLSEVTHDWIDFDTRSFLNLMYSLTWVSTKLVVFLPVTGHGGKMKLPLPPFICSPASLLRLCRPNVMFKWPVEIDIMFSSGTLRANNASATFLSTLRAVLTDFSPCKMKQNITNKQVKITKRSKAKLTKRS